MTEFLLIRHAVNDFVKTGKLAGWTPEVHLNEDGKAQAAALGLRLATVKIDVLYSSPLERTVETAQAVIEHHPELQLQTLDDIGEVRYGTWQGAEIRKLAQRKMWHNIQHVPSRVRFPNGEAMRDTQIRAVNALERLAEKHPRQTVAVVSHSDVIKMIVSYYLGMHLDLFQRIEISPASLTIIYMSDGRPTIGQVNETSYLPKPERKPKAAAGSSDQPVQAVAIGAVGVPGERTFYLQSQQDNNSAVLSFLLEKTQAMIIAEQVDALLSKLAVRYPGLEAAEVGDAPALQEPGEVKFRAGKVELQYNLMSDLIGLRIQEMKGENQPGESFRLWATRQQMRALADQARQVAASGLTASS
jgi:probable phosphomutase (TIGR03848 family)/uncharacterized repeat protein (TIGR03847 family)